MGDSRWSKGKPGSKARSKGDTAALDRLVRAHKQPDYVLTYLTLGDPAEAEGAA